MSDMRNDACPINAGFMPYVGMRPFGREEKDWFYGRSADGRIIADKILSARLTLLYAPSGVGKSSVLNASTIPALEDDDCCVMSFDAWAGSDPTTAIKEKLAAMAASIGVVEPLAGAPTVAELARLMAVNGKTLVLVFDQFEEFLVNHANMLDPLRKEVATLVRAQTIDARVLICLREEFLAALEPFRQEILTLFQSTYRLEPLAIEDVEKAIVKPARLFHGTVDPVLAQRVIDDLSEGQRNVGEMAEAAPATPRSLLGYLRKLWSSRSAAPAAALLASAREPSLRTGVTGAIDLPMLQLICEQMWRVAPMTDGLRRLTLDLYEKELGGKDKILNDHMRSCMPVRWRDRVFTAQLMLYMAPPSGMKISYSAADLAAYSALDKNRVEAELMRLSGADTRILRRREYHRDVRYELQHDALVRHVAPWRDDVLEKAAVARWTGRVGVAIALIIVLAGLALQRRIEMRVYSDDQFAELAQMSEEQRLQHGPARFETVVNYLLIQDRGTAGLDHLKRLLEQNAHLLPKDYGTLTPDKYARALGRVDKAPLALRYSQDRVLDEAAFMQAWVQTAQHLTQRWGISVPQRIALIADPGLTFNEMFLESGAERLLSVDVEAFEDQSLVQMKNLAGPAKGFRERFKDYWTKPKLLPSDDWWVVPRWSLPVWRAAGLSLHAGGAYPAFALEAELQKNPTVLMTPAATYFLVKHVATQYPCTAAEAWARRGIRLKQDLAAFVRGPSANEPGHWLNSPQLLLELLATTTDDKDARQSLVRSDSYVVALDATRRGNWPLGSANGNDCALPVGFDEAWDMTAFGNAQEWLPPLQPKLRLSLGADLIRAWSAASGLPDLPTSGRKGPGAAVTQTWATPRASQAASAETVFDRRPDQTMAGGALPALTDAFERHRREMYARSGVWLLDVSFGNAAAEFAGPRGHQFRIAVLDTSVPQAKVADAGGSDSAAIARVMLELDAATAPATHAWIDAEFVGALLGRDDALKNLVKNWTMPSITDLTLLLREVVAGAQADATTPRSQSGRTIRDPAWLLTSLVFWKSYYENGDPKNPPKDLLMDLAGHLRRLEAGKSAAPKTPLPGGAAAVLERGITALYSQRYKEAEQLFEQALKLGSHSEVANIFVARYSAGWRETVRQRASALCEEPKKASRDKQERVKRYKPNDGLLNNPMLQVELQSWLAGQNVGRAPNEVRNLALCLLSSMPETMPMAKDELRLTTAMRYGEPNHWPQAHAWWFALELLSRYDPTRNAPDLLKQGTRFIDSVVGRFEDEEAETAFSELSTLCNQPGPKAWCWQLLPKFAQATHSPWIALQLASIFNHRQGEGRNALLWIDSATKRARARKLSPTEHARFEFFVTVAKTNAQMALGENVDQKALFELSQSAAAKADNQLKLEAMLLAIEDRLRSDQDPSRLLTLVKQALQEWPHDVQILANAAIAGLHVGDLELVKQTVDKAYLLSAKETLSQAERDDLLFIASYAGLVTNHKDAVVAAVQYIRGERARYGPIVAMLLHTRAEPKQRDLASRRLNELWRSVDVRSWDARIRGGDERVWHEMLLGYFKGVVPEAEIFGPLRDQAAFQASKLAGLGFSRSSALTEANFYDALRRKVKNDNPGAQESLNRVVKAGYTRYIEYTLAVHLLRNESDPTTKGEGVSIGR